MIYNISYLLTEDQINEILNRVESDPYKYRIGRGFQAEEDIQTLSRFAIELRSMIEQMFMNNDTWTCKFCNQPRPNSHKDDCPITILFDKEHW